MERIEAVGGTAEVVSAMAARSPDHHGTMWTLYWDGAAALTTEGHPRARPRRIAREAMTEYGRGFVTAFVLLASLFHTLSLFLLVRQQDDYRSWPLAVACWSVMAAAGAVLVVGTYRASISTATARVAGLAVVVAAATVAVDCHPWAVLGFANWAVTDSIWLLILIGVYRTMWDSAIGAGLVVLSTCLVVMTQVDPLTDHVVKLVGIVAGTGVIQIGAAFAVRFMRTVTTATSEEVWRASSIVADRMAAHAAREYRMRLYAQVDATVIALLRDIADGRRDPADPAVRYECQRANDVLRQCSTLREAGARDLILLIGAAGAQGVTIEFPIVDRLDDVELAHRRDLIGRFRAMLAFAQPGRAVVTVQAGTDLLAREHPRPTATGATPLSASIQIGIAVGAGPRLRTEIGRMDAPTPLEVSLDLYDDEGNASDETATLAMMKAVLYV
jgi:hypothetical protein